MIATTSSVFTWKQAYEVGNPTVDSQHRKLVGLVSDLHTAMSKGQGRPALTRILQELLHYTVQHFKDEEIIMSRAAYPKLVAHIAMHCDLTLTVNKLYANLQAGKATITVETLNFLKTWLNLKTAVDSGFVV